MFWSGLRLWSQFTFQIYTVPFLTAQQLPKKDHHYIYLITAFKNTCLSGTFWNEEFQNLISSQDLFSVLAFVSLYGNPIDSFLNFPNYLAANLLIKGSLARLQPWTQFPLRSSRICGFSSDSK